MSEENLNQKYSFETPLGEAIENKNDFSGLAVETFPNGDKYEGNFERGVKLTRKNKEKGNICSQMEMYMRGK